MQYHECNYFFCTIQLYSAVFDRCVIFCYVIPYCWCCIVSSYVAFCCIVLHYILFYWIASLPCLIVVCNVNSCPTVSGRIELYSIIFHKIVLYCIALCCIAWTNIESYRIALRYAVLYYIALYCIVLYDIIPILYCLISYCIVLFCIVLYRTAQHFYQSLHHCFALDSTLLHHIILYCALKNVTLWDSCHHLHRSRDINIDWMPHILSLPSSHIIFMQLSMISSLHIILSSVIYWSSPSFFSTFSLVLLYSLASSPT